ncbi:type IV toxin-antitoxin system AbiEi family antitoxin domain-containing protein [Leucobacter sp. W1478]|uniref:type IV toxin-antitoxin system AbiEi family antitoxin domain-containing protein n=1 Tax=Leucobacter sp. W1478 TaxID=3439065 RepID=UPI003F33DA6C
MTAEAKYRDLVREIALDHYGYVTTQAAAAAGVPPVELPKLASRGGLNNIAYGLYRVADIPPTPFDQYAEALLRVGEDAYLHGESVLALFSLAEVNPRKVRVAVPRRARPRLPAYVELTQAKPGARITHYEGLRAQPVADALLESRGRVQSERLIKATKQARAEGLLSTTEWQRVKRELEQ